MDAYTGEIHRIFPLCNRVWPIALPVVEALCPNHAFACSRTHKTQGLRIVCHHKLICCWGAMQVLQIKKDEEERKKKEEDEERTRMERERERVRKDREREMRLKARQDEEVRRRAHSGCNIRTVNNRIHLRPHIMPGLENARRETPVSFKFALPAYGMAALAGAAAEAGGGTEAEAGGHPPRRPLAGGALLSAAAADRQWGDPFSRHAKLSCLIDCQPILMFSIRAFGCSCIAQCETLPELSCKP